MEFLMFFMNEKYQFHQTKAFEKNKSSNDENKVN